MNNIQHEIDRELNHMKLPVDFADNIMQTKSGFSKPFYKKLSAAAILLTAVLILGTSVAATYFFHWQTTVNKQALPDLDQMTVYPYAMEGYVQKRYDSYKELKNELSFPLLDSEYSKDAEILYAEYISDPYNSGLQEILVTGFILGDARLIDISEDKSKCTWKFGKEFSYPVDLQIEILSDEKQAAKHPITAHFDGDFKFIEQYISKQGYKVNLIGTTSDSKDFHAVFVADGIRYTLRGGVTLEKMKEIVDSMQY